MHDLEGDSLLILERRSRGAAGVRGRTAMLGFSSAILTLMIKGTPSAR
jgi:hypothetical protein